MTTQISILIIVACLSFQMKSVAQSTNADKPYRNEVREVNGKSIQTYYYQNGHIRAEGELVNSKRNGQWKRFYEDGRVAREGKYIMNHLDGRWAIYDSATGKLSQFVESECNDAGEFIGTALWYGKDGRTLITESRFSNGVAEGLYKSYYDSKKVKFIASKKAGKWDGPVKEYYENDQIKYDFNYVDGLYDGPYKQYYDDGQIMIDCVYANGKRNGTYRAFAENGRLQCECNYIDGILDGPYQEYDERSGQMKESNYRNGQLETPVASSQTAGTDGRAGSTTEIHESKNYYRSGKLKGVYHNIKGVPYGLQTSYYENGQKQSETYTHSCYYRRSNENDTSREWYDTGELLSMDVQWRNSNDKIEGVERCYHKNGRLKLERPYSGPHDHGWVKQWDENGKLVKQEKYIMGKTPEKMQMELEERKKLEFISIADARKWLMNTVWVFEDGYTRARSIVFSREKYEFTLWAVPTIQSRLFNSAKADWEITSVHCNAVNVKLISKEQGITTVIMERVAPRQLASGGYVYNRK